VNSSHITADRLTHWTVLVVAALAIAIMVLMGTNVRLY
jgi:hypothetical protein